jgi:hypothetical protein
VNNSNARTSPIWPPPAWWNSTPSRGRAATATDDLAWADERDVLIAMTCKPYRREVVEAVRHRPRAGREGHRRFRQPGLAGHHWFRPFGFVVAADTPQFFPSSVSTIALLETLLSFVIAGASPEIVERVEKFPSPPPPARSSMCATRIPT